MARPLSADRAWILEILRSIAVAAAACGLAILAVDAAETAGAAISLARLAGRIWAILPVLGPVGAALAVGRWSRSGALVGWLSTGRSARRLVVGAGLAGLAASLGVLAGWELAPLPTSQVEWSFQEASGASLWTGPDGRVARVRDRQITAIADPKQQIQFEAGRLRPAVVASVPPAPPAAGPDVPCSDLVKAPAGPARSAWLIDRLLGPLAVAAWTALGAAAAIAGRSWLPLVGGAVGWRLSDLTAAVALAQGHGGPAWASAPTAAAILLAAIALLRS